jgi:hypothetical protein
MDELERICKGVPGLMRYYPDIYLEGLRKTTKIIRVTGVPAERYL